MSRETHARFLEKSVTRCIRRAHARNPGDSLNLDRIRKLRVQTVEPWKRIVCASIGFAILLPATILFLRQNINLPAFLFLFAFGAAVVLLGLIGKKEIIECALGHAAETIICAIIESL